MKLRPASHVGLAWLVVFAALTAACSGNEAPTGNDDALSGATAPAASSPMPAASPPARTTAEASSAFPFPTGPAVVVPAGYEPPGDIVDSTGAHLPANGKPTLVYVDAIW